MGTLGRWRAAVRAHPYLLDGLLAGVLCALVVIGSRRAPELDEPVRSALTPTQSAATALVFAALVLRRRWPLAVLAYLTVGVLALMVLVGPRHPFVLAVGVAAYTVGSRLDRVTALWAGGASAVCLGAGSVLISADSWTDAATLLPMVFTAMTTAVGLAVGNHRAYVAAVEERARRAEQSREEEAHRQVIEERMRIARELHDIVAHHIALINVQAGVAAHLVRRDPDATSEALRHVRAASRAVLSELSTLLGVLRAVDDAQAPVEPAPSLQRLDALLESFNATGLRLTTTSGGQRRRLPAGIDLAAYRIVQEALTNAHKHGGGAPAALNLVYTADQLVIDVRNTPATGDGPSCAPAGDNGSGHGLLGMRERVAAVGGTFHAGPEPDGGFAVHAALPLPEGHDRDDPGTAR
ncbi:MAG TPA: sensor histidine kinase [Catenuloplanes sp.]|jgi:signal transduction histidine kinase